MTRRNPPPGLAGYEVGSAVRVVGAELGIPQRVRLAELGLRVGVVVTVLSRTVGGGRVVGVGTGRIAVDATTARRLAVEPAA